ncbi:recombinase family protein [Granulicella tundricola]|uniref:Resolvase domain protein n=1 Tax=Granulicella tundricola (strain ATCC BAA-1859 / DSM 23138 / MP5ACTX9) TaxID=1198114 RepID=E8X2D8_GRATM|nr:recombinase family protein [Granulicella tundricola]ADW68070.1 Resolvase domain protein [Granulicella tundricola MP5ACTX9]
MIVGYARTSTNSENTDAQRSALRQAGCKKIYEEVLSGRTMDRPELERCLNRLEKADTLIVWRLDRLARSLRDLLEIISRLEKSGIVFVSLKEKLDTSAASGWLIFHIFASLTQFERELISERTTMGLAEARARGRVGGRKRLMSAQQIRAIKTLWANHDHTKQSIATQFGVSISTVDRIVRPKSLKV